MQSQKLLEILENPYELTVEDMSFLEELCSKYPYCQTIQILLAKCYQKTGSYLFEKQVNLASTYSINRQRFQSYISEKERVVNISEKEDEILSEYYSNENKENISKDSDNVISEADMKLNPSSEADMHSAYSSESTPEKSLEDDLLMKERKKQLEQIVLRRINAFKNKDVKKEAPVIASSVVANLEIRKKVSKQDEIIDKFIREEPRINKPKDDAIADDIDLSSNSVEFNDDIISETLAEIYLKQGKNDRALYIFEKLCLKFPEKSSYFAKKIEQIKKSSKTNKKKKTKTKKRT